MNFRKNKNFLKVIRFELGFNFVFMFCIKNYFLGNSVVIEKDINIELKINTVALKDSGAYKFEY